MTPVAQYARRFFVTGRVQGVGFRWFVQEAAERLGLVGFVRNLEDGRVEVFAEGDADTLGALQDKLQQGPGPSRVDAVKVSEAAAAGCFTGFHIRHGERVIG
jgi:acylphosphatase